MRADVAAWFGDLAVDVSVEQELRLAVAFDAVSARYPGTDKAVERAEALSVAVKVILGEETLEAVSEQWHLAKRVERVQVAALTGALIATPGTEKELGERSGAARVTIRRALGRSVPVPRAARGRP